MQTTPPLTAAFLQPIKVAAACDGEHGANDLLILCNQFWNEKETALLHAFLHASFDCPPLFDNKRIRAHQLAFICRNLESVPRTTATNH